MTALTWVILVPAVGCWPAAAYLVFLVHRSGKRHAEQEAIERARLLAAHANESAAGSGDPDSRIA